MTRGDWMILGAAKRMWCYCQSSSKGDTSGQYHKGTEYTQVHRDNGTEDTSRTSGKAPRPVYDCPLTTEMGAVKRDAAAF